MSHENRRKRRRQQHTDTTQPAGIGPLQSASPNTTLAQPLKGDCNPSPRAYMWKIAKMIGRTFGFGIAALGAIAFFFDFSPKISVSQMDSLDPSDAFSTPFLVSNDGNLPIKNVSVTCVFEKAKFGTFLMDNVTVGNSKIDVAPQLSPGEKMTVPCRFRGNLSVAEDFEFADIRIMVRYQPYLWPFSSGLRLFRFQSVKSPSGAWYWIPQPLSK